VVSATVVAVGATGALAAAVRAEPAPDRAARAAVTVPAAPAPPAAQLPAVTQHPVDPALLAAVAAQPGGGGGQTVTQTIQLTIVGGDLELATDHASIVLHRVEGSDRDWTGTLPPVQVVDARGTGEGWRVRWAVDAIELSGGTRSRSVPDARVRLEPGDPIVVDGAPDGLAAGSSGPALPHGRTLFTAEPGSGGGTYEAGGTVSLRLPPSVAATAITVELTFALG
jgi:hypothetical protein